MNLIIADTNYILGKFIEAMDLASPTITSVVGQHSIYEYEQYDLLCTVKGFDHEAQIRAIRLRYQDIEHVVFINRKYVGPPSWYFPDSVEDFVEATGLELSTAIRQKLQERIFFGKKKPRRMPFPTRIHVQSTMYDDDDQAKESSWRKRLREPEDGKGCVACMEKKSTVLLVPCQHQCLCDDCAEQWVLKKAKCPLCQSKVDEVWRPRINN